MLVQNDLTCFVWSMTDCSSPKHTKQNKNQNKEIARKDMRMTNTTPEVKVAVLWASK